MFLENKFSSYQEYTKEKINNKNSLQSDLIQPQAGYNSI